jgi:LytS/YehU family sensor histidine kinase
VGTTYAKIATAVARKVLPVIKNPLNEHNAAELAEEIFHAAKFGAVSITDGHKILAFHGIGCDHHLVGKAASPEITRLAEQGGEVVNQKSEIGCSQPNCPLDSVIAVPICCGNERVGVLEVYKTRDVINPPDVTLVTGIAHLLSQQLNDARLTEQSQQLIRAEYNLLRSQINPHFLFNSLSVIKLFIRTDPEKAQSLLLSLAAFFRKSLQTINDIVTLAEEMQCVEFYLDIQKARFGERLQVDVVIDDDCLGTSFPAFALQPLVENALNHGLSEKKGQLCLLIEAHVVENVFTVAVTDNGIGIATAVIEAIQADMVLQSMGFGLTNVNRRLRSLYGDRARFCLVNKEPGTRAEIRIDLQGQLTGEEGV